MDRSIRIVGYERDPSFGEKYGFHHVAYIVYLVEGRIAKVVADPKKYNRVSDALVQATIIFDLEGLSMQHVANKKSNATARRP
jgi:hypothetical protein